MNISEYVEFQQSKSMEYVALGHFIGKYLFIIIIIIIRYDTISGVY